jgi:hypothetical protein
MLWCAGASGCTCTSSDTAPTRVKNWPSYRCILMPVEWLTIRTAYTSLSYSEGGQARWWVVRHSGEGRAEWSATPPTAQVALAESVGLLANPIARAPSTSADRGQPVALLLTETLARKDCLSAMIPCSTTFLEQNGVVDGDHQGMRKTGECAQDERNVVPAADAASSSALGEWIPTSAVCECAARGKPIPFSGGARAAVSRHPGQNLSTAAHSGFLLLQY